MSNNIFSTDPTIHQASLANVNLNVKDDPSYIVLGKVTKVYYKQGTLDFQLSSGVASIVTDGSGNGSGSARIPLDYFGQDNSGRTYGHYRPVQVGDTVAIAYLNGHLTSPIVIGVYAPNGEQYEAISPTLFSTGDDKDDYIAETGLAERHIHHSGQISYRSGSGKLFESLNGYSYMVIDDDTSQDYSQLYVDLSLVPYSSVDGETRDPEQEKAGDWLLVHEDNPNGQDVDDHITRFYVNQKGAFELVFTNNTFAGVSTVLHGDKNGMKINKYLGHTSKKAGLARANEEDQTITADFDSAPTHVTFDLGETKEDVISLKTSSKVNSQEQATNLEVRTDGIYINDTKLFDSASNKLANLNVIFDGGVLDFSKLTVKNLSGDLIADGTIEGSKLKDKTVTADKLNVDKLSDISTNMGTLTSGSIKVNNGTKEDTSGVVIKGDASSDPNVLTDSDKAYLQQQLNALYSQAQALMDYGKEVNLDTTEIKTTQASLKQLTNWIFETSGNVTVERTKIDEAITAFSNLLETYRTKFTSQVNQKIGEVSNKANSIFKGSSAPTQAQSKEGDLWLQTNSDGTSNLMQYSNGTWSEATLKGYKDALAVANKAQETADKLPHNYFQATQPSGTQYNDGDLWYQEVSTTNGKTKYNVYKWDTSTKHWIQVLDNNASNNYVANSAPADPNEGDFWTDIDGTLYQYQSGSWKTIPTQGPQGVPGSNGTPGKDGIDGISTYVWIKYATSESGANMSDSPVGATYIGLATGKTSSNESSTPSDYKWTKIKGEQGVAGTPGIDGKTPYVHIAYANSHDGKTDFTTDGTKASQATLNYKPYQYMGTYVDYNQTSSTDPSKYTWTMVYDKTKSRNFTSTPTTPYSVGDTWTQSGATYFCTTERLTGSFTESDWTLQQLTLRSLDNEVQATLDNSTNLVPDDGFIYYDNKILDHSPQTVQDNDTGVTLDYYLPHGTTTLTTTFKARADVAGAMIEWFTAYGDRYSQGKNNTTNNVVYRNGVQIATNTSSNSWCGYIPLTTEWATYTTITTGTWPGNHTLTAMFNRVSNANNNFNLDNFTTYVRHYKVVAGNNPNISYQENTDSITTSIGENYWDNLSLQKGILNGGQVTKSDSAYYTPWYPISEYQRVFMTNYTYQDVPGVGANYKLEFADANKNYLSDGILLNSSKNTLFDTRITSNNDQHPTLRRRFGYPDCFQITLSSHAQATSMAQSNIQSEYGTKSNLLISSTGITYAIFNPVTHHRDIIKTVNTYASDNNVAILVKELKEYANTGSIITMVSHGYIASSATTNLQELVALLKTFGLPSSYTPNDFVGAVAFAFIGFSSNLDPLAGDCYTSLSKGVGQTISSTHYISDSVKVYSSPYFGIVTMYALAPKGSFYFRAGAGFTASELNRVGFMVTVDKLPLTYSSNLADFSKNAVRKNVSYKGVTINDSGLTATLGNSQVVVNSSSGFEIKKSGNNVFAVDTKGNLTITGSTISTGNISGVNFQGNNLTLSGTLTVDGSIVGASKTFTITKDGMIVSPTGGGNVTISSGGLTITGTTNSKQGSSATYGNNDTLAKDAGLFATKDSQGNTKTWITSSGTLVAQDAVVHGNVSVDSLTLTSANSKIMFGSGFTIDGNGHMTITSSSTISNGVYTNGAIKGSELDLGTTYHSRLSNATKYRYTTTKIGETTTGMAQDIGDTVNNIDGELNGFYISQKNDYYTSRITTFDRNMGIVNDRWIYVDGHGFRHRFFRPVANDANNEICIFDLRNSNPESTLTIDGTSPDEITNQVIKDVGGGWSYDRYESTEAPIKLEFIKVPGSIFTLEPDEQNDVQLYPKISSNNAIKLTKGETYLFGAYFYHVGLKDGIHLVLAYGKDKYASGVSTTYKFGNTISYQQSGYSTITFTPDEDVYFHGFYGESANKSTATKAYTYGVPISVSDPFAVRQSGFTSKLFGGTNQNVTKCGYGGTVYPHISSKDGTIINNSWITPLALLNTKDIKTGDIITVSLPINYENPQKTSYAQLKLQLGTSGEVTGHDITDLESQPLNSGFYYYEYSFVWRDEYKAYVGGDGLTQLFLYGDNMTGTGSAYVTNLDNTRMGIWVGSNPSSSSTYVNEYQTRFTPLGTMQFSHNVNVGNKGYTMVSKSQMSSEGITMGTGFSTSGADEDSFTVNINTKSGITFMGHYYSDPGAQPTLTFTGAIRQDALLKNSVSAPPNWEEDTSTYPGGIWYDTYGNGHGFPTSQYLRFMSSTGKTQFNIPLRDGNTFDFKLAGQEGYKLPGSGTTMYSDNNAGSNVLHLGLVHFYGGGYIGGYYPALYAGSGDSLCGISFGDGFVVVFGNRQSTANRISAPNGSGGWSLDSQGKTEQVTPGHGA